MEISFKCHACGHPGDPVQLPGWAKLWAFGGCHTWLEGAVPPQGDPVLQLDQLPSPGERHRLIVSHPFRAQSDQPFWLFFTRAGWDDTPEKLPDSGMVHCRLSADFGVWGTNSRVIEIEVLDSFFTSGAAQRFTPIESGDVGETCDSGLFCVEFGDLHYRSWNGQGDIGGWFLFQHLAGGWAAVLYGEWDFHRDYVYSGHRPLTGEEYTAFGLPDYG